jgi:hypothetical protein
VGDERVGQSSEPSTKTPLFLRCGADLAVASGCCPCGAANQPESVYHLRDALPLKGATMAQLRAILKAQESGTKHRQNHQGDGHGRHRKAPESTESNAGGQAVRTEAS